MFCSRFAQCRVGSFAGAVAALQLSKSRSVKVACMDDGDGGLAPAVPGRWRAHSGKQMEDQFSLSKILNAPDPTGEAGPRSLAKLKEIQNCQLMLMAGLAKRGAACGRHLCTIGPFPGQPLRPCIRARFSCALAMPESRASWVRQSMASQQAQALLDLCWPIWARIRSGNQNTPT